MAVQGDAAQGGSDAGVDSTPGNGKDKVLPKDVAKALDRASGGKSAGAAGKSAKPGHAKSGGSDSGGAAA